ncbi:MAG: TrbI/VirB10 family protein, partial [Sphingobium sp.]
PYESATARTMERLANRALEQAMSRPPTVTINQGTVLNVYVAKDVDFSAVLPGQ